MSGAASSVHTLHTVTVGSFTVHLGVRVHDTSSVMFLISVHSKDEPPNWDPGSGHALSLPSPDAIADLAAAASEAHRWLDQHYATTAGDIIVQLAGQKRWRAAQAKRRGKCRPSHG